MNHRIIFLFTPGPIGGAEKVIMAGLTAMVEKNISVELWLIKEMRVSHVFEAFMDQIKDSGIPVFIFESRGIFDFKLVHALKLNLRLKNPKILHAHGFKAAFYAQLTLPKIVKLVITHHGKTSHTLKVKIYEMLETIVMKKSHAVIAVSHKMKGDLKSDGIHDHKIHLVENIFSLKSLMSASFPSSNFSLLFIGRLSPEKGCHFLIEALSQIALLKRPRLIIVGDGQERIRLIEMSKHLNVTESVEFKGFQNDIHPFLAEASALIMPSLREGQPLALIEACCFGLPVVGSSVGGIPELISHNYNGLLVRPGHVNDLANKIQEFQIKAPQLSKNSQLLKKSMIDRFSKDTWVRRTAEVYETVLSHS
jgi:glycosyltransferase involved in cell wall biosynthesis